MKTRKEFINGEWEFWAIDENGVSHSISKREYINSQMIHRYMPIGAGTSNMHVDTNNISEARDMARRAGWSPEVVESLKKIQHNIHDYSFENEVCYPG